MSVESKCKSFLYFFFTYSKRANRILIVTFIICMCCLIILRILQTTAWVQELMLVGTSLIFAITGMKIMCSHFGKVYGVEGAIRRFHSP
jgi:hypothetical protein